VAGLDRRHRTVFKFASGWLCEIVKPPVVTAIGLVLQAAGMVIFGFADSHGPAIYQCHAFGTGWGLSYVAATVLLIAILRPRHRSQNSSLRWFIGQRRAFGPVAAGFFGDNYGTFAPIYVIYGAMMALLAFPILVMRRPAEDVVEAGRSQLMRRRPQSDPRPGPQMTASRHRSTPDLDTMLVTMDAERRIVTTARWRSAATRSSPVGKSDDLRPRLQRRRDHRRATVRHHAGFGQHPCPCHRGPLTKGLVPDDTGFEENVFQCRARSHAYTEADSGWPARSRRSRCCARDTTCFLEAGTIRFLDPVVDGLEEIGIRARVANGMGLRARGSKAIPRPPPTRPLRCWPTRSAAYPADDGTADRRLADPDRHMTCSGALWAGGEAARRPARPGFAAHMSPVQADPDWYIARHGKRPVAYLAELGASQQHDLHPRRPFRRCEVDLLDRGPGQYRALPRPAH